MEPRSNLEPQGASPLGCALLAVAFLLLVAGGGVAWMVVRRPPPPGPPATVGAPPMAPVPTSGPSHPPMVPQPVAPPAVSPPVAAPTPVAPVVPTEADVRGALDRDVIRRVVRRHMSEVRTCYERGLAVDPTLSGAVSVSFFIGGSGTIDSARVSASSLAGPQAATVNDCVVARVRTWVFPAPDGGGVVAVNYPFVFSSP